MATDTLPLTAAQHGIWLGQQLDPISPAYWTAEALELQGPLDLARLQDAVRRAIDGCEALHQCFESDGEQVRQQHRPRAWSIEQLTLSEAEADAWMRADLLAPSDLRSGPLFHTALLHTGPARTLWYLRVHHVALDGYGYALLAQRVADLYGGTEAPERRGELARVVTEDAVYRASDAYARDRAFWQARLADAAPPLLLADAKPVADHVRRVRGDMPALFGDLGANVIAAVAAWLQRESGASELILGLPVMNRLGSSALDVPCMAMNIVPLRLRVDPDASLRELTVQVAGELRAIRPHQRYRYEDMKHDLGRRRLFGAVVNLMPFDRPLRFGEVLARLCPISAGPVEDLAIAIAPQGGRLRLDLDANPDAYDATRLTALHARLAHALQALAAAPERAIGDVLGRAPLAWAHGEALAQPPEPVLAALRRHAHEHPDRNALEQDGEQLSYGDLLAQVQALAGQLRASGVVAESRVALLLERRPHTIVAMLATLWTGGGYVPLDPHGPALRIAKVLEDAQPALIVSTRAHAALAQGAPVLFLDDPATVNPMMEPLAVGEDALAYVIYTSGSTGRPNGVMIARAALAHFVAGASLRYAISGADRVLQFAPIHFDASVEEIYLPLCAGGTLVLRTEAMLESLPAFAAAVERARISVLDLPTAFWHELAYAISEGQLALPDSVRLVIIGGEAALQERIARWRASVASSVRLLNTYGPTETTVIVTSAELAGPHALPLHEGVPIGLPLPGTAVVVLDRGLRPVAPGIEGELCVAGPALARGYLGQPELTARRFVTIDGQRLYRTGDRAVLNGQLRYLGRFDAELKLSGQRIDPLEIEAALLDYPGLRETAVVALGSRLHAFLCATGEAPAAEDLRAHLAQRLPPAALPAAFHARSSLPRNHNGKIDRAALRALAADAGVADVTTASAAEQAVMAVWREVLGLSALNVDDDFFALGGRSLQAIQAANRLGIALQREVPVAILFRHPTVAALARGLDGLAGHAAPPGSKGAEFAPLLTIQPGQGPALFCLHPAEGLSWCYLGLTRHLPGTPIYGLQARGITGAAPASIDALLDDYLAQIRAAQPHGPYRLLGWSSGGGVAHALAVRLQGLGEQVALLAMMDAYPSDIWDGKPPARRRDALLALLDVAGADALGAGAFDADGRPLDDNALLGRLRAPGSTLASAGDERIGRLIDVSLHTMRLYRELRHQVFDGALLFFHASQRGPDAPDWRGWAPYVSGPLDRVDIDATHNTMSRPAPLAHIGRALAQRLALNLHTNETAS